MTKEKDFLDLILEEFGDAVVIKRDENITAISTGSLALDASIGIGGIPRGKITEISGPPGSGKTTIALSTMRNAVKEGGKVLYMDLENSLNYSIIDAMIGMEVPEDKFILLTADNAENAFDMIELAIKRNEFDLIVIDSVGVLISKKELKGTMETETMTVIPRLMTKFLKRICFNINFSKTALLVLNQIRANIGGYARSYVTTGGKELEHLASVRISLTKGQTLMHGTDAIGIISKFVVKKNKLAPPFRGFTLPIVFGKGVDTYMDSLEFCEMLGVVKKSGSYYKLDGETIGQGKVAASNYLRENPEALSKITEMVYGILNDNSSVIEDIEEVLEDEDTPEGE